MLNMLNFDKNLYSDLSYLGCAENFADEILDNIEQINLLQSFSVQELKVIFHYLHCYAAPKGYILFEEGHMADHLIIVLSGEVLLKPLNTLEDTNEANAYGVGTTLGETSLVDPQVWKNSCLTNKPSDFAVLTRDSLNEILLHNPRLANKLLLALMQRIAMRLRNVTANDMINVDLIIN
jgi:CRP/FNR family transcriptional regulator, cyclic AMP receptor protein